MGLSDLSSLQKEERAVMKTKELISTSSFQRFNYGTQGGQQHS
jgi:hypothetical protein